MSEIVKTYYATKGTEAHAAARAAALAAGYVESDGNLSATKSVKPEPVKAPAAPIRARRISDEA